MRYINEKEILLTGYWQEYQIIGSVMEPITGFTLQVSCNGPCEFIVVSSIDNKVWHDLGIDSIDYVPSQPDDNGMCSVESTYLQFSGQSLFWRYYKVKIKIPEGRVDECKSTDVVAFISGLII